MSMLPGILFDASRSPLPSEMVARVVAHLRPVDLSRMLHLMEAHVAVLKRRKGTDNNTRESTNASIATLNKALDWFRAPTGTAGQMRIALVIMDEQSHLSADMRTVYRLQAPMLEWYAAHPTAFEYPYDTLRDMDVPRKLRFVRPPALAFGPSWTLNQCLAAYRVLSDHSVFEPRDSVEDIRNPPNTDENLYDPVIVALFRTCAADARVLDPIMWLITASDLLHDSDPFKSAVVNRQWINAWTYMAALCISKRLPCAFGALVQCLPALDDEKQRSDHLEFRKEVARRLQPRCIRALTEQARLRPLLQMRASYNGVVSKMFSHDQVARALLPKLGNDPVTETAPYDAVHDIGLARIVRLLSQMLPWDVTMVHPSLGATHVMPNLDFITILFIVATRLNFVATAEAVLEFHTSMANHTWQLEVARANGKRPELQYEAAFGPTMNEGATLLSLVIAQASPAILEFWLTAKFPDMVAFMRNMGENDWPLSTERVELTGDSDAVDLALDEAARDPHMRRSTEQEERDLRVVFYDAKKAPAFEQIITHGFFDLPFNAQEVMRFTWLWAASEAEYVARTLMTRHYVSHSLVDFYHVEREAHVRFYYKANTPIAQGILEIPLFHMLEIATALLCGEQDPTLHAHQMIMLRNYLTLRAPESVVSHYPLHLNLDCRTRLAQWFFDWNMEDALRIAIAYYPECALDHRQVNCRPLKETQSLEYRSPNASYAGVVRALAEWKDGNVAHAIMDPRSDRALPPLHGDLTFLANSIRHMVAALDVETLEVLKMWRSDQYVVTATGDYAYTIGPGIVLTESIQVDIVEAIEAVSRKPGRSSNPAIDAGILNVLVIFREWKWAMSAAAPETHDAGFSLLDIGIDKAIFSKEQRLVLMAWDTEYAERLLHARAQRTVDKAMARVLANESESDSEDTQPL